MKKLLEATLKNIFPKILVEYIKKSSFSSDQLSKEQQLKTNSACCEVPLRFQGEGHR